MTHPSPGEAATPLVDGFGRAIEYLRLSITEKCNLKCFYCRPARYRASMTEPAHWLTFDEIVRLAGAFTRLGVRRVRLTGGEPLVRAGAATLAARLAALPGLEDLSLSTNGALLARHAVALRDAGVTRLNVSLDTLRPDRFRRITGGDLGPVLEGLRAARRAGFRLIKINAVALKGVNDDELGDLVAFCGEHGFTLRFIETMPMGEAGRSASAHYLDLGEVRAQLARRFDLLPAVVAGGGPARYVRIGGSDLHVGFITPLSQHFCATCNRVRVGVDGTLYPCLGRAHSVPLRERLRSGASDDRLEQVIRDAVRRKPERHEFREHPESVGRCMAVTGG